MSIPVTVNREHKSTLFYYIFGSEENKKYLLSLYNAVNNTSENNNNIYGKTLVKIPTPRYIVFYNGDDSYPDKLELKLSDAFERPDSSGQFEWTATMLNINNGHNQEIMDKCQALFQYSEFVATIKEYKKTMPLEAAVDKAVIFAISNNYLDGFFKKHREGIMLSCLTEFNEEAYRKGILEEGFAAGFQDAMIKFINNLHQNNSTKEIAITQIVESFGISEQDATTLVNEHWE